MPTIETKSQFAIRRGVKPSAVSNWIARGQLAGKALTEDGKIVVELAEAQLGALIDPGRGNPSALLAAADAPPNSEAPPAMPSVTAVLADIRVRREALALEQQEQDAARRRGELIIAAEAERAWGEELADLMAAIELFVFDLPHKLGLDRDSMETVRREWRAFRQRQADQAEAGREETARAA